MPRMMLHGAYRNFAGGRREVTVEGATVREALAALAGTSPRLAERLHDEHGHLREHLSLFVNTRDVRDLQGEDTAVTSGDLVHLIPALSGGSIA